jgi:hypothetical protein
LIVMRVFLFRHWICMWKVTSWRVIMHTFVSNTTKKLMCWNVVASNDWVTLSFFIWNDSILTTLREENKNSIHISGSHSISIWNLGLKKDSEWLNVRKSENSEKTKNLKVSTKLLSLYWRKMFNDVVVKGETPNVNIEEKPDSYYQYELVGTLLFLLLSFFVCFGGTYLFECLILIYSLW